MNLLELPMDIYPIIFGYLKTKEICKLLEVSKKFIELFKNDRIRLNMDFKHKKITDNYLSHFHFHTINLSGCQQITDHGLEFLEGVHTIILYNCDGITDCSLEFLKGVHTINLTCCNQITNNGLEFLKGVHTINLSCCNQITNNGLEFLKGVHTIDLS